METKYKEASDFIKSRQRPTTTQPSSENDQPKESKAEARAKARALLNEARDKARAEAAQDFERRMNAIKSKSSKNLN